ncbi:AlpA family transcriptional regulator [Frankia sp. CiP3]|uniref:helix-turn-helix transcriptional regulator n=1 Tax=Frankia sp. CiP3 TaxID=2880971 RepID=UPI001EF5BC13|nr:DNA-binding protein [Frankia sp. CiP3]
MTLVGIHELAEMMGVSRTRADQLSRRESFPEPAVHHARVRLWDEAEVREWIRTYRSDDT